MAQTAGIGRIAEGSIMESRGTGSYSLCRVRGWPPASMTYQQDPEDLAHHEAEIRAHQSFNYGLFDDAETALPGCVYIDPLEKQGADAEIFWRVVDGQAGSDLQRALDAPVPGGVPLSGSLPSEATSAATCPGQTGPPWRTLTRPLPRCCQGLPARNNYRCINNQSKMRKITIAVGNILISALCL
jgi:hypothetical protein